MGHCSRFLLPQSTEKVGTFQTKKAEKITLDDFRARKLINYCHTTMYVKPHCRALIIALHCSGIRAEHLFRLGGSVHNQKQSMKNLEVM